MSPSKKFGLGLFFIILIFGEAFCVDYGAALTKALLFFEGQRSGKLPTNQRVTWRGDSGLRDGSDIGVDLVGGYYDAGDRVKFGFPLAYTVTMLAWSLIEFESRLSARNETVHVLEAIRWGTDYLIKAHPEPNVLYAQVGDGDTDHQCWNRPEEMTTPRTVFKIDAQNPGSDLAGETAAAFAAASLVFSKSDLTYSAKLLIHAKQLFEFANNHRGLYSNSIPSASKYYKSSDEQDELLWAASWLYRATEDGSYVRYIDAYDGTGGPRSMFSWDDKYVGVQLFITKMILDGKLTYQGKWADYKNFLDDFVCNCAQKGKSNVKTSGGGLLWWSPWNNLQYTTAATFITVVYAQYLSSKETKMWCNGGPVLHPNELIVFAQTQVNYILGINPHGISYMVGHGSKYPRQIHHRGASIVSIKADPTPVSCSGGYDTWYKKNNPDPNVLHGAVVGGPDDVDAYTDNRDNFQQSEPALANTAPLVGILAMFA